MEIFLAQVMLQGGLSHSERAVVHLDQILVQI